MYSSAASALAVLAIVASPAVAHSWVEQMMVIGSNGQFTGQPGYARNNTLRTAPGFSDLLMVHILPGQGQPTIEERDTPSQTDIQGIQSSDPMCKKTQQTQFQSNGSPRLKAAPGDMVALRYEENGHVSLPANQPGKPANRGNVYIYGTTQPKTDEIFLDIYGVWNEAGTGGDKRGKLLATQPFDDGQCYQINGGNISTERQAQFPHTANQLMGANLWCQNDIKIPTDAPSGKPYTLYWVWDWPTAPGVDPSLPKGKAEIYTTCMDVDITGTKASRDLEERQAPAPAASGSNIGNMAIPKYVKQLSAAPVQAAAQPAAAPVVSSSAAAAPPAAAAPASSAPAGNAAQQVTVTVTVGSPTQAQSPATQAPPAQANTQPSQAPAASAAAAQPAANSMPPKALNIAAPVLSAGSGNAAPAASPATFSGTASAVTPSTMVAVPSSAKTQAAAVGARSCSASKCPQKRSKIFGSAAH